MSVTSEIHYSDELYQLTCVYYLVVNQWLTDHNELGATTDGIRVRNEVVSCLHQIGDQLNLAIYWLLVYTDQGLVTLTRAHAQVNFTLDALRYSSQPTRTNSAGSDTELLDYFD